MEVAMTRHPRPARSRACPSTTLSSLLAGAGVVLLALTPVAAGAEVVERFAGDPLSGRSANTFFVEGDAAARFTFLAGERPHFQGDRRGTLRVLYDTTLPTARLSTPIGGVLSLDEDVEFGAILTIRSSRFHADPQGFSQIAFGLWNAGTTGLGRTLFPSDAFDLVEFDYFANVTEFGGPFLSPTVFGGSVGGNAFFNFTFGSQEVALPFDVPLLCRARYEAAARRLTVTVSRLGARLRLDPIPGASVSIDLDGLSPTYLLDVVGIAAYGEGWPSLRAEVDYDLLYVGPLPLPFAARTTTGSAGSPRLTR
jgi:hypothetical protein